MKNETVETVSVRGNAPDHRAEAAVLMRSLRVFDQAIVQLRAVGKVG